MYTEYGTKIYQRVCNQCGNYYEGIGKKYCSRKCANILTQFKLGKLHSRWIDGRSEDKKSFDRERRHKLGISKKYIGKYNGSRTLTKRESRLFYKYNFRNAGKLTIETIQKVYEDNIKCFGTLTCVYCLEPIPFGKDSLEHIIPLSRGGSNGYKNLAIACCSCNSIKRDRLIEEVC